MIRYYDENRKEVKEKNGVFAINYSKKNNNEETGNFERYYLIKQNNGFLYNPFDKHSNPNTGIWKFEYVTNTKYELYEIFLKTNCLRYKLLAEREI